MTLDDRGIRPGDEVFISPGAGIHGHGCWWAEVVSTMPGLVPGNIYIRVVPLDNPDAAPKVYYARTDGLLVNKRPS